jgi:hypothetical protein
MIVPEVTIFQVQYVQAGIAIACNEEGDWTQAILLEEFIDQVNEGGFRKFIGNLMPKPLVPTESVHDYELALFYCACQHIQWSKTGGMAFISDFQGE